MENRDDKNQSTSQQTDLSKAQNQSQPQGQADYGSAGQDAGQSDTASKQRSAIEGDTSTGKALNESNSQFVGSKGASDTSSELVEDDETSDFAKDGQGAAE